MYQTSKIMINLAALNMISPRWKTLHSHLTFNKPSPTCIYDISTNLMHRYHAGIRSVSTLSHGAVCVWAERVVNAIIRGSDKLDGHVSS
jgi:hypothetical protein